MRDRKRIEEESVHIMAQSTCKNQILILEVLLDIRDAFCVKTAEEDKA